MGRNVWMDGLGASVKLIQMLTQPYHQQKIRPLNLLNAKINQVISSSTRLLKERIRSQFTKCKWLAKKSQQKIGQICGKNVESYNGTGPAKDTCKVLCGTCPS